MAPLPSGATLDRREADRIASDHDRLGDAYQYWRRRFEDVGEDPFASAPDTPAMRFIRHLPADRLDILLPERRHLTSSSDPMTTESGCLIAADDLARAVDSGSGSALFQDLGAFAGAAIEPRSSTDSAAIARGVRAARELFDAARRFVYCSEIGAGFGLGIGECLALFRQEAAFVLTPPLASYPHGPLVRTGFGCRFPNVSLFDGTAERPGFVLNYQFRSATDALATPVSRSFDALYRNLLVIGGLDTIVLPRLPATDEMVHFMGKARGGSGFSAAFDSLRKEYRDKLSRSRSRPFNAGWKKTQQGFFDEVCIGLTMARVEEQGGRPKALYLLDELAAELTTLIERHPVSTRTIGGSTRIFLEDDDEGAGVRGCLEAQFRWFASRADPRTLYARRDRPNDFLGFERFSPYLTYLRFHAGDAVFVGILLRCIVAFEKLDAEWKKNRSRWGESFRDALEGSLWSKAVAKILKGELDRHWRPRVGQEDAWRHIGLVNALDATGTAPSWLTPPPAIPAKLLKTAEVAKTLMDAIQDQDIQSALELALEFTPISTLDTLGIVPNVALRTVFGKSHSFERMRRVYQETLDAAGL